MSVTSQTCSDAPAPGLPDSHGNHLDMTFNEKAEAQSPETIELPEVTKVDEYISHVTRSVVGLIMYKSRRRAKPKQAILDELPLFLNWAETLPSGATSLNLKQRKDLMFAMAIIFEGRLAEGAPLRGDGPFDTYFSDDDKHRARSLHEEWSSFENDETAEDVSNVVQEELVDEDDGSANESNGTNGTNGRKPRVPAAATAPNKHKARLPPEDHPIYGKGGPMDGVIMCQGRRKYYALNPRRRLQKRSALKVGNNGLVVGSWWPIQMAALFNGAHGATMGGISGLRSVGAVSIVVSSYYHDLDKDCGNKLYYSAAGSHDLTDPNNPADTSTTDFLHKSLETGHPVRVLRSSTGNNRKRTTKWAPKAGIRYDGLYRVVDVATPKNNKGGKYHRFELHRIDGQPRFDEQYALSIPSKVQMDQFNATKEGY